LNKMRSTVLLLFVSIILYTTHCFQVLPSINILAETPYDFGFQLGKTFSSRLKYFYDNYTYLYNTLLPFYKSVEGSKIYKQFYDANQQKYPDYINEVKGMSVGSGIPFENLMLVMFRPEIDTILRKKNSKFDISEIDEACSDVFFLINDGTSYLLGHNEDANPLVQNSSFWINANLLYKQTNTDTSSFSAYSYPQLPGVAFGYNENIVYSMNSVSPVEVVVGGIARYFIARDVLHATDIEDAISRVSELNVALGFNMNIAAKIGNIKHMYSVEIGPGGKNSVKLVGGCGGGTYYHFNMYRRLDVTQYDSNSTLHRQVRADQFALPENSSDVLDILGDNQDKEYPIYRNGQAPDSGSVTVSTVLFDLDKKKQ